MAAGQLSLKGRALSLLSRREHSRAELERKLGLVRAELALQLGPGVLAPAEQAQGPPLEGELARRHRLLGRFYIRRQQRNAQRLAHLVLDLVRQLSLIH